VAWAATRLGVGELNFETVSGVLVEPYGGYARVRKNLATWRRGDSPQNLVLPKRASG
jgi:hypothetical protein